MAKAVCILTPAYNAGRYLAQAVESALAQTHPAWRMIIVNDGSKDNTLEIAQSFAARDPRITVLTQPNSGISATRNVALSHVPCDCEYLFNLDADDVLEPTALEELVAYLDEHPKAGAVFCASTLIDGSGNRNGRRKTNRFRMRLGIPVPSRGNGPIPFLNVYCAYGIGPFALIRKSALPDNARYNVSLPTSEDVDMFVRIGLRSEIHQLDRALYLYRWHGLNSSTYSSNLQRDQDHFYAIWDAYETTDPTQQKALREARRFRKEWHPLILRGKLLAAYTRDLVRKRVYGRALIMTGRMIPWAISIAVQAFRRWATLPWAA